MGTHDHYGKSVMRLAAGSEFQDTGADVFVRYGDCGGATVDGVVGGSIAVEIESRVSKQVRGAVLDLICHPFPKKLLVLLPVHMSNPDLCKTQCTDILGRFLSPHDFRVVLLAGHGAHPVGGPDAVRVQQALTELGVGLTIG
jgi:hypothetical protein